VGGAGSVGNDGVGGLQHVVVHAVHDGGVNVLAARCGDDHLFGTALEVGRSLFLAGEEARALQNDVDVQLAPGQSGRIAIGQHADAVAIDDHVIAVDTHGTGETAVCGVML